MGNDALDIIIMDGRVVDILWQDQTLVETGLVFDVLCTVPHHWSLELGSRGRPSARPAQRCEDPTDVVEHVRESGCLEIFTLSLHLYLANWERPAAYSFQGWFF